MNNRIYSMAIINLIFVLVFVCLSYHRNMTMFIVAIPYRSKVAVHDFYDMKRTT
jgi:hypothetical protein